MPSLSPLPESEGPQPQWPQWLHAQRLDDSLSAAAYATSTPEQRACLKNGVAFQALSGEQPELQEQALNDKSKGYWQRKTLSPAPWTLLFIAPHHAAAPRLVAALMPALLARVPLIGVVAIGDALSPAHLLALELMGVEDVFQLGSEEAYTLMQDMRTAHGRGRVLLLNSQGKLFPLCAQARQLRLPLWEEAQPPRIAMTQNCRQDLLRWAHPDALFLTPDQQGVEVDAFFTSPSRIVSLPHSLVTPLCFTHGMEGCWRHEGLDVHFFQQCHLMAGSFTACESHHQGEHA